MFLIDKYYNNINLIACHQNILNRLLNSFDTHYDIYNNFNSIKKDHKKVVESFNYINTKSFNIVIFNILFFMDQRM